MSSVLVVDDRGDGVNNTPAGWYPQADGSQRYWDGARWTEHVAPAGPPNPTTHPANRPAKPWYKSMWFVLPAIFVVLLAVVVVLGIVIGGAAKRAVTGPAAAEPAGATIGTPVTDGEFEFVVNGMRCGIDSVGEGYAVQEAQGEFCELSLTVKNTGNKPQTLLTNKQSAYDTQGREFSPSTEATMTADGDFFREEINPGNSAEGAIYFDVPKGTQLAKVELHDSFFSAGVVVTLPN